MQSQVFSKIGINLLGQAGEYMKDKDQRHEGPKKIQLGRLHIDPVFFLLLLFSVFSVFLLGLFLWLAS